MQITIVNGAVEYDGEPILSQIDFTVRDREKIALVGRNGCGKTTLLKAIVGQVELVRGTGEEDLGFFVSGKPEIGYLQQVAASHAATMYEEVTSAYAKVIELENRMNAAQLKMEKDSCEENVRVFSSLCERYENEGGYTYKKECLTAIRKFGFSDADMQKPLNEFSGGQRTKIALLKLLLSRPELLLLDEPTNHLDVEAIEWLENFLKDYKYSCVIVSHDRMFLDRVVNVVYEIEYGELTRYRGNYTAFSAQKKENYDKAVKEAALKYKEIERLQKIVEKFRYKANKAAMAQAKLAQIRRIGTVEDPARFDTRTFRTSFNPAEQTTQKTLVMEKLSFGYDKPLGELSAVIEKGDKVGIIGANGCGKSTLVHTLMRTLPALSGTAEFGVGVKVGYFDQTLTQAATEDTVLDSFRQEFPSLSDTEARTALGSFMFCGEDVFKRVCDLSGGEKVRLALCRILKRRPNLLILDEPTNHMDIVGKESFEALLKDYGGTVIVVSHDRYLINKVCNRLIVFSRGKAELYDCDYTEYERIIAEREKADEVRSDGGKQKKGAFVSDARMRDRIMHRIAVLEDKISQIEDKIAVLRTESESPAVVCDYKRLLALDDEIKKQEELLAPLMSEWEELLKNDL